MPVCYCRVSDEGTSAEVGAFVYSQGGMAGPCPNVGYSSLIVASWFRPLAPEPIGLSWVGFRRFQAIGIATSFIRHQASLVTVGLASPSYQPNLLPLRQCGQPSV